MLWTLSVRSGLKFEILYIKWNFVRGSFVGVRPFFLYCAIAQFCCTCAVDKKRKSGPRAQKGSRATRTSRGLIHGYLKAANKGVRCSVLHTKRTAPEPRMARAHKLVIIIVV